MMKRWGLDGTQLACLLGVAGGIMGTIGGWMSDGWAGTVWPLMAAAWAAAAFVKTRDARSWDATAASWQKLATTLLQQARREDARAVVAEFLEWRDGRW